MKSVGFLKFILVASLAAPQLMVAMAERHRAERAQACPVCYENMVPAQLHGNHRVCPACFEDQITAAHNARGGNFGTLLHCPCMQSGVRCNYQITLADVTRIAPQSVAQFQAIQHAQAEKAIPVKNQTEDRENLRWKFNNTQPCPNCHRAIEKNGGCKLVRCAGCRVEFCHECLNIIHGHDLDHQPCFKRDGWAGERAKLFMEEAPMLILGGIVLCTAIWGISELYEYFKKKKAKKVQRKNGNHYPQPYVHG